MVALFRVKNKHLNFKPTHWNSTQLQKNEYAWVNDSPYFGLVKLSFITRELYLFSIVNYAFKLYYRNKSLLCVEITIFVDP